jgi:drug/metabolite transporter (DMT)-like permease
MPARAPLTVWLALAAGLVCFGFSAILIRYAGDAPALVVAAWRTAFAALLVAPAAMLRARADLGRLSRRDWGLIVVAGLLLALHFMAYILSLYYTSVASSSVLVTSSPIFIAILGAVFLKERPTARTVVAIVAAVLGGALIGWSDAQAGDFPQAALGNVLALSAALLYSVYLLVGRAVRQRVELLAYMAPVYVVVAICTTVAAAATGAELAQPASILGLCLLMAVGPNIIGHGSINLALRYLPAALLGLLGLAEPVLSTTYAYLLFGEQPAPLAIAGIGLVLGAIGVVILAERRVARAGPPAAD